MSYELSDAAFNAAIASAGQAAVAQQAAAAAPASNYSPAGFSAAIESAGQAAVAQQTAASQDDHSPAGFSAAILSAFPPAAVPAASGFSPAIRSAFPAAGVPAGRQDDHSPAGFSAAILSAFPPAGVAGGSPWRNPQTAFHSAPQPYVHSPSGFSAAIRAVERQYPYTPAPRTPIEAGPMATRDTSGSGAVSIVGGGFSLTAGAGAGAAGRGDMGVNAQEALAVANDLILSPNWIDDGIAEALAAAGISQTEPVFLPPLQELGERNGSAGRQFKQIVNEVSGFSTPGWTPGIIDTGGTNIPTGDTLGTNPAGGRNSTFGGGGTSGDRELGDAINAFTAANPFVMPPLPAGWAPPGTGDDAQAGGEAGDTDGDRELGDAINAFTVANPFVMPPMPVGWTPPSTSDDDDRGDAGNTDGDRELGDAINAFTQANPFVMGPVTERDRDIADFDQARTLLDEANGLGEGDEANALRAQAEDIIRAAGFNPDVIAPILATGEYSGREVMRQVDLSEAQALFDEAGSLSDNAAILDGSPFAFEAEQMRLDADEKLRQAKELLDDLFLTTDSSAIVERFSETLGAYEIAGLSAFEQAAGDEVASIVFDSADPTRTAGLIYQGFTVDAAIEHVDAHGSTGLDAMTVGELHAQLEQTNPLTPSYDELLDELNSRAQAANGVSFESIDVDILRMAEAIGGTYLNGAEVLYSLELQSGVVDGPPGLLDAQSDERAARAAQVQGLRVNAIDELSAQIDARPPFARDGLLAEREVLLDQMFGSQADQVAAALSAGAPSVEEAWRTVLTSQQVGADSLADVARFERSVQELDAANRTEALEAVWYGTAFGLDPADIVATQRRLEIINGIDPETYTSVGPVQVSIGEAVDEIARQATYDLFPPGSGGPDSDTYWPEEFARVAATFSDENPGLGALIEAQLAQGVLDDILPDREPGLSEAVVVEIEHIRVQEAMQQGEVAALFDTSGSGTVDQGLVADRTDALWNEYFTQEGEPYSYVSSAGFLVHRDRRDLDAPALALRLGELREDDPALAQAVWNDIDQRLSGRERRELNPLLLGDIGFFDSASLLDDAPGQVALGAGKGLVNDAAFLAELAINYGPTPLGVVNVTGGILPGVDRLYVVDIPELEASNLAQSAGMTIKTHVEIAALPFSLAYQGPGIIARGTGLVADFVQGLRAVDKATDVPVPVLNGADEILDAISGVNPRHISNNCGTCTTAVHDRLGGVNPARRATDNTLTLPEMEAAIGAPQVTMSPDEIADALRAAGPGSRAVVGVDRSNGAPGHWFNAYFDGTDVFYVDGQIDAVVPWGAGPDLSNVVHWDAAIFDPVADVAADGLPIITTTGRAADAGVDGLRAASNQMDLHDPMLSVQGPGRGTDEFAELVAELRSHGFEIVEDRPGALAYSPGRVGEPGRIILDPNASLSALRHEAMHAMDDLANGFPGMGHYMQNPRARWLMEERAYDLEIQTALDGGYEDAARQLIANKDAEYEHLRETFPDGWE